MSEYEVMKEGLSGYNLPCGICDRPIRNRDRFYYHSRLGIVHYSCAVNEQDREEVKEKIKQW